MPRALAASVVVALCGGGAHVLAGGQLASWMLPALVAAAFPVAHLAARGRLGTGQLLGLLLLGQAVVHGVAGHGSEDGAAMLAAHGLATALSLLLVRRGEDAWWRIADALVTFTSRVLLTACGTVPPRTIRVGDVAWFPVLRTLVTGLGERAPPAPAV